MTKYQDEYSNENLLFYNDVTLLENGQLDDKKFRNRAQIICKQYLGIGEDEKILNISDSIISQICDELSKSTIDRSLFARAKTDIEMLLKSKFIIFKKSKSKA